MKKFVPFTLIFTLVIATCFIAKAQVKSSISNIHITKFDVFEKNSKIAIRIETDGSVQTNYFEIQKSTDGINFKTIALILGPDPKETTCDCYGCFDKILNSNTKTYYRAKHIDTQGIEQLSNPKLFFRS